MLPPGFQLIRGADFQDKNDLGKTTKNPFQYTNNQVFKQAFPEGPG
jgi:hypothetical protein